MAPALAQGVEELGLFVAAPERVIGADALELFHFGAGVLEEVAEIAHRGAPRRRQTFGLLATVPLDGPIDAQPLVVPNVIVQGDPILNLIYDRNVKFNFYVYGDFDISRTEHPTPAGADVIRRLIVQWGGHLDKTLNIETDFVVMGTPPEIPIYSPMI